MKRHSLFLKLVWILITHPVVTFKNITPLNIKKLSLALFNRTPQTVYDVVACNINHQIYLDQIKHKTGINELTPKQQKVKELESKYPGITNPSAIANVYALEEKIRPIPSVIKKERSATVNFLLPQLDPLIMFGGYIACLQFIRKLVERGYLVRILLCESNEYDREAVLKKLSSNPPLMNALAQCDVVNVSKKNNAIEISPEDSFIAYSVWTGLLAHHLAKSVGKKFIFFVQEFEAIFHSHDSFYAMAKYVYSLPHIAMYNTSILQSYFQDKKLGVYATHQSEPADKVSLSFQHALTKTTPPTIQQLRARERKRLLFYGRPEDHAKRNLFEIALIGLKIAVYNGVFDNEEWEFIGVGTLGTEHEIPLGKGQVLFLTSTLPQQDYGESLKGFDIGLSLMLAPHPSIIPFEMASSGIITVTNCYDDRDSSVLENISENIIPCEPDMYSVAEALALAVQHKVNNYEARIRNSKLDWVMDWDDTFNKNVMEKVERFIEGEAKA